MLAHGHVEMEEKVLKNYGGTWTCRDEVKMLKIYYGA